MKFRQLFACCLFLWFVMIAPCDIDKVDTAARSSHCLFLFFPSEQTKKRCHRGLMNETIIII